MDAPPPGDRPCLPGMPCEPSYDDSGWVERTVPHDFVIEGTVDPNLDPTMELWPPTSPGIGASLPFLNLQGTNWCG